MLSVPAAGNRRGHFSLPSAPPKKGAQLQEHCSLGHLARTLNSDVRALSCFSHVRLSVTLWTVARRAPLATEFSRQEYWSGLLCPFPGDLLDPGIKPVSLMSPALAGRFLIPLSPPGKPLNSGKEWVIHFWGLVMGTWKDKEKKPKLFYWFWKSTIELKIYLKQKKKKSIYRIHTRDVKESSFGKQPVQNWAQPSSWCCGNLWFSYFFLESPRFLRLSFIVLVYKIIHSVKITKSVICFNTSIYFSLSLINYWNNPCKILDQCLSTGSSWYF